MMSVPSARRVASRFLARRAGILHVPPRMAGTMAKWLVSRFATLFLDVLRRHATTEAESFRQKWKRLIKVSAPSNEVEMTIDLAGWRYLPRIDEDTAMGAPYWGEVTLTLEPVPGGRGSWSEKRGILRVDLPDKIYENLVENVREQEYAAADRLWRTQLAIALDSLQHEMTHMAQSLLEVGLGSKMRQTNDLRRVPGPGLPSKKVMTPQYTQHLDSPYLLPGNYEEWRQKLESEGLLGIVHELDDVEFYTRLVDEIRAFKAKRFPASRRLEAFHEFTGSRPSKETSSWLLTLKQHAPGKWRQAVKEMAKALRL